MAILLTGGAGYIGSNCFYAFVEENHDLIILDDLSTGNLSLLPKNVVFHQGNVGDATLLYKIFSNYSIDTVIHFAGSIVVSESVSNPGKYYRNNTSNSLTLLEACIANGIPNFIFSSTASVYGNRTKSVCLENDQLQPENPYASSKMMTEMILKNFHAAHGLNYIILRYFNVAGADPHMRSGQISRNATHLIKVICEVAIGKRSSVPIYGTNYDTKDGTCIRDYIHVTDLAMAHLEAYRFLRSRQEMSVGETFNCGYGHGYSVREVIETFERETRQNIAKTETNRREGDPVALIANSDKIRTLTNWKPTRDDLKQIVTSALKWEETLSGRF